MSEKKAPFIRLLIAGIIVAMIFSLPLREFLKTTFLLGIPFVFVLGMMVKKRKYSLAWNLSLVVLVVIVGFYGYLLTNLPERIETREIIRTGSGLIAECKYDQAITEFKKLEALGKMEKMEKKIEEARTEQKGAQLLDQARELIEQGEDVQAIKVLESIPPGTRASREAVKLSKSLNT